MFYSIIRPPRKTVFIFFPSKKSDLVFQVLAASSQPQPTGNKIQNLLFICEKIFHEDVVDYHTFTFTYIYIYQKNIWWCCWFCCWIPWGGLFIYIYIFKNISDVVVLLLLLFLLIIIRRVGLLWNWTVQNRHKLIWKRPPFDCSTCDDGDGYGDDIDDDGDDDDDDDADDDADYGRMFFSDWAW